MKTWEIIELVLKKPIEQIVDVVNGKWLCEPCKSKKMFFSLEAVIDAAKDKAKVIKEKD